MGKESITSIAILNRAIRDSKFNTKKSKLNKKWTRYLKNNKLFDEYMIYLSNHNVVGAEPKTYKQLSNLCYNLSSKSFFVKDTNRISHHIVVDWVNEFHKFAWKSIKWYDLRNMVLYLINNGYE